MTVHVFNTFCKFHNSLTIKAIVKKFFPSLLIDDNWKTCIDATIIYIESFAQSQRTKEILRLLKSKVITQLGRIRNCCETKYRCTYYVDVL